MLARSNPFGFIIVMVGLALFLGILLGIALIVTFLATLIIGLLIPFVLMGIGLVWMSKPGKMKVGLVAFLAGVLLFLSQAYGWLIF